MMVVVVVMDGIQEELIIQTHFTTHLFTSYTKLMLANCAENISTGIRMKTIINPTNLVY